MRARSGAVLVLVSIAMTACTGPVVVGVADGTYTALVPTTEQLALDAAGDIPGGFAELRASGVDDLVVLVEGDEVSFQLDGKPVASREVVERVDVVDREGSGPFKAQKQVLILGSESLVLGELSIDEPVIWPGSFEGSPVITVKPWNPDERGPDVSCAVDEACLLLSSPISPTGRYENVNNPELGPSPVSSIEITDDVIEFARATDSPVRADGEARSISRACGMSATPVWDVPPEAGVEMGDPVLVHTLCPSQPGAAIRLVIMERAELPVLAPLGSTADGAWCIPGPSCLIFAPV